MACLPGGGAALGYMEDGGGNLCHDGRVDVHESRDNAGSSIRGRGLTAQTR